MQSRNKIDHAPVTTPPDALINRSTSNSLPIEDSRIARTVAYIHQNVHRPFGVEELLDVAAMPRRTFEHLFVRTVGITPYSYITRVRVERATSLLTGTPGYSLTEIACLSGFTDLRRFRLVFRRLMGMPPAMYRQMHRDATTSVRGAFESFPSLGKASRLGIFQPALAPDLPA